METSKPWPVTTFKDLYLVPSKNGTTKPKRIRGSGVRLVNMGEVFSNDRIEDIDMERAPADESEISRFLLMPQDLLFARRSIVREGAGKCSIIMEVPETTIFESSLIRVRLDPKKANPLFYFYYFSSNVGKANMQSIVNQLTVAGIRGTDLAELEVPYPPISSQTTIGRTLSLFDDSIKNNIRRIQILEEMARTIYRDWFVQFGFPGHEKVEMVNSELGQIPEGWEIRRAPEAIDINPMTPVPKDGIKKYIPMTSVAADSMMVTSIEQRSGNTGAKFLNGDTLFPQINPSLQNGKMAYVQFLDGNEVGLGTGELIVLRSKTLCPEYVYLLASTYEFRQNAINSMVGASGRQRVQKECFDAFQFPHPTQDILREFRDRTAPMFSLIQILWDINRKSREMRDSLLPRLISGEIDVSELDIHSPSSEMHETSKYEDEQSELTPWLDGDEEDA